MRLYHALVGFKEIRGAHDGENLAEYLIELIQELGIEDKIGVFVGDNAGNIDTAVAAVVRQFRPSEVSVNARRSRCLGHIINLAAKAFIFGSDVEAFEDDIAMIASDSRLGIGETDLIREQQKWRSRGPVGKLHNIVVYIRATTQRRQAFERSVNHVASEIRARGEELNFTSEMMVILDVATRWNSSYQSIQRCLLLKRPIQLFLFDFRSELENDWLKEEDWEQLRAITAALGPFHLVTKRLEGEASTGSHGVIWEALLILDHLMSHVEDKKAELEAQEQEAAEAEAIRTRQDGQRHRRRINPLSICYQNAWQVLQKYNTKTDQNHEIYAAATLLNPCMRKRWFIKKWTGDAVGYIDEMVAKNRRHWEVNYKENLQNQPQTASDPQDEVFDDWLVNDSDIEGSTHSEYDEFSEFIDGSRLPPRDWRKSNLFAWWVSSGVPALQQWALDSLSVPAMSAEVERCFSKARRLVTFDRNRLTTGTMEVLLCYKHWLDSGILELVDEARQQ